jgi:S1-C subfamily serine protease
VIQGASEATVKLADGRDYQAALVGVSPAHDIAVLKIGVGFQRPPAVPVGTSADLKVGQRCSPSATPSAWIGHSPTASCPRSIDRCPGNLAE